MSTTDQIDTATSGSLETGQEPEASTTTAFAALLARMVPNPPAAEEVERLRLEAETARTAAAQAKERVTRLVAEIAVAKTAAQPRPDLAQAMAELTAKEIEARVKGLPMPKGHADRMAEARAAIAAAEARRAEAELTLPALESLRAEIDADAHRAADASTLACAVYGNAAMLHLSVTRYLPALAAALEVEAELAQIEDTWGGNVDFGLTFQNPSTGDKWTRRDVETRAARLSEEHAGRPAQAAPLPQAEVAP